MKKLTSILVLLFSVTLFAQDKDLAAVEKVSKKIVKAMKKGDFDKLIKFAAKGGEQKLDAQMTNVFLGKEYTCSIPYHNNNKIITKVDIKENGKSIIFFPAEFKYVKEDGKWKVEDFEKELSALIGTMLIYQSSEALY